MEVATIFVTLQIMCLNAMNHPRNSFIATSLAAVVNIVLNLTFIPVIGITGAALATLISIALNAFLSYYYLSQSIAISLERSSIRNILIATIFMSGPVLLFRFSLGISSLLSLFGAIIIGAGIYFIVLFRLDQDIWNEMRDLIGILKE
jgi:O-antigen/teichoic acid export membrane protein